MFDNYPGAPNGGTQRTFDIDALPRRGATQPSAARSRAPSSTSTTTTGPNAGRGGRPGARSRSPTSRPTVGAAGFCEPTAQCSWNPAVAHLVADQPSQNAVQAHYYVSHFHDHLAELADRLHRRRRQLRGRGPRRASTPTTARPPARRRARRGHVDNANMRTPPDGQSPLMQMYLFEHAAAAAARRRSATSTATTTPTSSTTSTRTASPTASSSTPRASARSTRRSPARWARPGATGTPRTCSPRRASRSTTPARRATSTWATYTDGVAAHPIRTEALDCPRRQRRPACPGGADVDVTAAGHRPRRLHATATSAIVARRRRRCTPTARSGRRRCGTCAGARRPGGQRSRLRPRRAARHRRHAAVAARAVVPRHAQRDPRRRRGASTAAPTTT